MQTKVVIGTVAFMLTMIIFGLATLLEPARLQETTDAFEGRQIENGAVLFQDNCATCHGVEGRAEQCSDVAGNPTACVGRPLNNADLLCTDSTGRSQRMVELNWSSSQENLIYQAIASGRLGTLMPVWSQEFGGPMEPHQIEQLTQYVLNWAAGPDLCGEGVVVEAVEWPESSSDLPTGDPASGEALYTSKGCIGCHGDPGQPGSNAVGPHLGNIGNVAAERVAGQSAADYIYQSILNVNAFIAPICARDQPCTEPSAMQANFGQTLTEQEMADLIAYLLGLTNP